MRPEPCGPLSLTVVLIQDCPCILIVLEHGHPDLSQCLRPQRLVFNKVPVSASCMPLCKVTHHCSYRSLWTRGLMGLKMLRVNIDLV